MPKYRIFAEATIETIKSKVIEADTPRRSYGACYGR